jgi:hypothetical protein
MKTVWKYKIPDQTCLEVELPLGSYPLWGHIQDGEVTMWVEVDKENPEKKIRKFYVYGTGYEIPFGARYVTTVYDVRWIWHIYEVTNVPQSTMEKCNELNANKNKMYEGLDQLW